MAVSEPGEDGKSIFRFPTLREAIQKKQVRYDKDGDNHYDVIPPSSKVCGVLDPDAAVHWLARMIAAGEDGICGAPHHDLRG